ncbi:protein odr-4 homolog isoform X1 [Mangifera indica]|uniref:protein odr-4 homolog isoform X1 n=1 Tax=Mangifera indica TaxID=29780 RepID=UPI001CF9E148|nr:protein odr-4 homolog isoform X1 [Mangifera indica]
MVKGVVGEETQLKLAEDRLSQSTLPAQVGLVIGKLSSTLDRGFVFDLIPTPQNDAGEAVCFLNETSSKDGKKKTSKSKSQPSDSLSLVIDQEWVAEHARQVSRMLLGGIKVIGIYVWASDSSFKNSTVALYQTVSGVAREAPFMGTDGGERLIIHICYSPRRWTCRSCMVASNTVTSTSLRPCDIKMGKVLNSLQTFKCTYNFSLGLPICNEGAPNAPTLSDILRQGILNHAKELRSAKAILDGNLVVDDEPCTTDGLHEVELLLPFLNDTSAKASNQKDVVGLLVFNGSLSSFAYLNLKEPISEAISEIKGDIIRSLQSRLDIICDEADEDQVAADNIGKEASNGKPVSRLVLHSLRKTCSLSFPRRVFLPWLAGTFIGDYLQSSETLEVIKDHLVELMSMEPVSDSSEISEAEVEAPTVIISKSFWDVADTYHSGSNSSSENKGIDTKEKSKQPVKTANYNLMAAVFFLVLSILLGLLLTVKRP